MPSNRVVLRLPTTRTRQLDAQQRVWIYLRMNTPLYHACVRLTFLRPALPARACGLLDSALVLVDYDAFVRLRSPAPTVAFIPHTGRTAPFIQQPTWLDGPSTPSLADHLCR